MRGDEQKQQKQDRQQRAGAHIGQIQRGLVIEHLAGDTLLVTGPRIMLVEQADAVKSEQEQQRALDYPAAPAQPPMTAMTAHAQLCLYETNPARDRMIVHQTRSQCNRRGSNAIG
jgi:hypothetical protein